jgi:DNA-binding GntR family transcriptional regulator
MRRSAVAVGAGVARPGVPHAPDSSDALDAPDPPDALDAVDAPDTLDVSGAPDLARDRSLRAAVERYILDAVHAGRLQPGARIKDAAIARALGISQTPVREAILRLAQDGILEHQPRRGFFLAQMRPQQRDDVYLFRAAVEGLAARLAAARIDQRQLAALERLVDAGGRAARAGNRLANVEADAAFHGTIVGAARHELVARTWRSLAPLQWLPRILSPDLSPLTPDVATTWVERHQRLLDVIRSGDADAAEAGVRTHVLRAGRVASATALASPASSASPASPSPHRSTHA